MGEIMNLKRHELYFFFVVPRKSDHIHPFSTKTPKNNYMNLGVKTRRVYFSYKNTFTIKTILEYISTFPKNYIIL